MAREQIVNKEFNKAFEFHLQGNLDKAQELYKKILKEVPSHFEALRHLGILYQDRQMYDAAEKFFMKAYAVNSNHFSIYNNLGTIKFLQFEMDKAIKFYKKAFQLNSKYLPVVNNISAFYHRAHREDDCMKLSKLALSIDPKNLTAKINYAKALSINNEHEKSIKLFEEILKNKKDVNNFVNLGTAYRNIGEIEKSFESFKSALKYDEGNIAAFFNLSASKLNDITEDVLNKFQKKLKSAPGLNYSDKATISFALFNCYNSMKQHEKASKYLLLGNKYLDNWIGASITDEEKFFSEIEKIFSSEFIDKKKLPTSRQNISTPKPIFIVGMPRSGTTLCEQILSSHSSVFGGGELQSFVEISEIGQTTNVKKAHIDAYAGKIDQMSQVMLEQKQLDYVEKLKKFSDTHEYVTDKLPHNFVLIGLIKIIFPNAKIIYCKRDMMDNCFSLFTHKFVDKSHGYCYSQKILGKYYKLHLKLMDHWLKLFKDEIYVLNHENLITNQEKYSKEIINYCELDWEEACLEFYKTKRQVQTASNEQVREPINKKSLSAWKKYESILEPLKKYLAN